MSKGLEALDRIAYTNGYDSDIALIENELKRLEELNIILDSNNINSLQELELKLSVMRSLQGLMTVKQSHPAIIVSKKENADGSIEVEYTSNWSPELSKQLTEQQNKEFKKFLLQYCGYDKLTEILKIIKEKRVNLRRFDYVQRYPTDEQLGQYNDISYVRKKDFLIQQEYDLLKEVLL